MEVLGGPRWTRSDRIAMTTLVVTFGALAVSIIGISVSHHDSQDALNRPNPSIPLRR